MFIDFFWTFVFTYNYLTSKDMRKDSKSFDENPDKSFLAISILV